MANNNDTEKTFAVFSSVIKKGIQSFQSAISTIAKLDAVLTDLRLNTELSSEELNRLFDASNKIAKQMGVSTEEILTQAAAWSRLGIHTAESAAQMAKLSAQLSMLSPGMTLDEATRGLACIMDAYEIDSEAILKDIISKIHAVSSKFSLTNTDIMAMLQDSAAAMAECGNTLEETIALETAAFAVSQDSEVGEGFRMAAQRLHGLNDETQKADTSLKDIRNTLYELTGVSIMADSDSYKSTYQILTDIHEVWDSLSDQTQGKVLTMIFGEQNTDIGASVLKNFDMAKQALTEMTVSAGNIDAAMAAATDSITYRLHALSETKNNMIQNLFQGKEMKSILDFLAALAEGLDWVTDKLGLFGTAALGASAYAGFQNIGKSI